MWSPFSSRRRLERNRRNFYEEDAEKIRLYGSLAKLRSC